MTMAHDLIIDPLPPSVDSEKRLTTWYAQGHSDGLGDRLLMFDNTSAPSWEILRFRPALAQNARFEAALRERVERLVSFQHPAFPMVRPIKDLGNEDELAVVSTYTAGVRLSEALKKPRSAAFAVRLIRQLAPALAALQAHGAGIAHGALDADRIVVTPEGELMVREHMVGAALASLDLPAAALWSDFHVIASPVCTAAPTLDARSDVIQLGLVTLSLLTGRCLGPDDYPDKIEALLDEIAGRSGRHARVIFQSLRYWLERALQLDEYMFDSAQDANDALAELRDEPESADDYLASFTPPLRAVPESAGAIEEGASRPDRPGPRLISGRFETVDASAARPFTVVAESSAEAPEKAVEDEDARPPVATPPPIRARITLAIRWVAAAVVLFALGEAMFIGRLLSTRTASREPALPPIVIESPRSAPVVELPPPPARQDAASKAENRAAGAPVQAVAVVPPRTGGFRLSSTVQVHVLDGDRVLGSSGDGPIVAAAGRREFEFVNATIGYRERRVVDVKAGQITSMSLAVKDGTLNINAVPWAAVWIDGNSIGETPIGNFSVAPGEHEILFRHPQLGERREKTIVRVDGPTRVSVNLQQGK
jgi:hypothetical protein